MKKHRPKRFKINEKNNSGKGTDNSSNEQYKAPYKAYRTLSNGGKIEIGVEHTYKTSRELYTSETQNTEEDYYRLPEGVSQSEWDQMKEMINEGLQNATVEKGIKEAEEESNVPALVDDPGIVEMLNSPIVEEYIQEQKGPGVELSEEILASLGFSRLTVIIHTDSNAEKLCKMLNARAFAIGNNIFFNKGEYNLSSAKGKELLAHELAHVANQTDASTKKIERQVANENIQTLPNKIIEAQIYNGKNVKYDAKLVEELFYFSTNYKAYQETIDSPFTDLLYFTVLVNETQQFLSNFYPVTVDGKFGSQTRAAMDRWIEKACSFNKKNHNYGDKEVKEFLSGTINADYSRLLDKVIAIKDTGSKEFAFAVLVQQREIFTSPKSWDGKLGTRTMEGIKVERQKLYDAISKSVKGSPSNDFSQLLIKNPYEGIGELFYSHYILWNNDPFVIKLFASEKISEEQAEAGFNPARSITVVVNYVGTNYSNTKEIRLPTNEFLMNDELSAKAQFKPFIYSFVDRKNKKSQEINYLFIDLYGDGRHIEVLTDEVSLNNSWSPPWRIHNMSVSKINDKKSGKEDTIEIKEKDSIPVSVKGITREKILGETTLSASTALRIARTQFNSFVNNPLNKVSLSEANWKKINEQLTNYEEAVRINGDNPSIAGHALSLYRLLPYLEEPIPALQKFRTPELYPAKEAAALVALVSRVYTLYAEAASASLYDTAQANHLLSEADRLYQSLPYELAGHLLTYESSMQGDLDDLHQLGQCINIIKPNAEFTALEYMLGLQTSGSRENVLKTLNDEFKSKRQAFAKGENVLQSLLVINKKTEMMQVIMVLLYYYQTCKYFDYYFDNNTLSDPVDTVLKKNGKAASAENQNRLKPILQKINTLYLQNPDFSNDIALILKAEAVPLLKDKNFNDNMELIPERLEQIKTVKAAIPRIAMTIVAALAASWTGPFAGILLRGLGAEMMTLRLGSFAAEVTAFTVVDQGMQTLAYGKADTPFLEALVENAALFAAFRSVGKLHQSFYMNNGLNVSSPMFHTTEAVSTLLSMQAFAEVQNFVEKGELMEMDARTISLFQNLGLYFGLKVGSFCTIPMSARLDAKIYDFLMEKYSPKMVELVAEREILKSEMDAVRGKGAKPDQKKQMIEHVQDIFNREMFLIDQAIKDGFDKEMAQKALNSYQEKIIQIELQLANLGMEVQSGTKDYFRVVEEGIVSYREGLGVDLPELMQQFYTSIGGKFTSLGEGIYLAEFGAKKGGKPGEATGESIFYVREANVVGQVMRVYKQKGKTFESKAEVLKLYTKEAKDRFPDNPEKAVDYIRERVGDKDEQADFDLIRNKENNDEKFLERLVTIENSKKLIEKVLAGEARDSRIQELNTYLESIKFFEREQIKELIKEGASEIPKVRNNAEDKLRAAIAVEYDVYNLKQIYSDPAKYEIREGILIGEDTGFKSTEEWVAANPGRNPQSVFNFEGKAWMTKTDLDVLVTEISASGKEEVIMEREIKSGDNDQNSKASKQQEEKAMPAIEKAKINPESIIFRYNNKNIISNINLESFSSEKFITVGTRSKGFKETLPLKVDALNNYSKKIIKEKNK